MALSSRSRLESRSSSDRERSRPLDLIPLAERLCWYDVPPRVRCPATVFVPVGRPPAPGSIPCGSISSRLTSRCPGRARADCGGTPGRRREGQCRRTRRERPERRGCRRCRGRRPCPTSDPGRSPRGAASLRAARLPGDACRRPGRRRSIPRPAVRSVPQKYVPFQSYSILYVSLKPKQGEGRASVIRIACRCGRNRATRPPPERWPCPGARRCIRGRNALDDPPGPFPNPGLARFFSRFADAGPSAATTPVVAGGRRSCPVYRRNGAARRSPLTLVSRRRGAVRVREPTWCSLVPARRDGPVRAVQQVQ